jgi:hypothetical protein
MDVSADTADVASKPSSLSLTSQLPTSSPISSVTSPDSLMSALSAVTPANRAVSDAVAARATMRVTGLDKREPGCGAGDADVATEASDSTEAIDANEVLKLTSLITEMMRMSANKTSLTGKLAQAHRENAQLRFVLDASSETNRRLQQELSVKEERFHEQQIQTELRVAECKKRSELDQTYFQQEIERAQERERQTQERGQLDLKTACDDYRLKLEQCQQQLQLERTRLATMSAQYDQRQVALNESKTKLVKLEAFGDRFKEIMTSHVALKLIVALKLKLTLSDNDNNDDDGNHLYYHRSNKYYDHNTTDDTD